MLALKEYLEDYTIGYAFRHDYNVQMEIVDDNHLSIKISDGTFKDGGCSIFKDDKGYTLIGTGGSNRYDTERQIRMVMKKFFIKN